MLCRVIVPDFLCPTWSHCFMSFQVITIAPGNGKRLNKTHSGLFSLDQQMTPLFPSVNKSKLLKEQLQSFTSSLIKGISSPWHFLNFWPFWWTSYRKTEMNIINLHLHVGTTNAKYCCLLIILIWLTDSIGQSTHSDKWNLLTWFKHCFSSTDDVSCLYFKLL